MNVHVIMIISDFWLCECLFPVKIIDVWKIFQIILTYWSLFNVKFRPIGQPTSWNSKISVYESKQSEKLKWQYIYGISKLSDAFISNESYRD